MISQIKKLTQVNYGTFRGWVRALLGQAEYASGRIDAHLDVNPQQVKRLIFVCLGNINRSAFAGAIAQARGLNTHSIGLSTTTGAPAFHTAVTTARGFGIDLSAHTATDISDYVYRQGDLLLAMEVRHMRQLMARGYPAGAIAPLGNWSSPHRIHLHDPHTLSDEYFQTCFTLIQSAVTHLAEEFRVANSPCINR